jgi:hypothetical protein
MTPGIDMQTSLCYKLVCTTTTDTTQGAHAMDLGKPVDKRRSDDGLRQIPSWASRYANNRTLPILVSMAVTAGAAALIAGLAAGAGRALRDGHPGLGWSLMGLDLAFCAWWVWLVLGKGLNRWMAGVSERMYRGDGLAVAAPTVRLTGAQRVVPWVFGALVCATPIIAQKVPLPDEYLQPLTALYTVPFMLYLWWLQGRFSAPFMLLWPVLYAAHAVAVLAGMPLLRGIDPMMQVLLPMFACSLVAAVASNLYGRYALRKLRALAATAPDGDGEAQ